MHAVAAVSAEQTTPRHHTPTPTGWLGIAYTLSWIAGLSTGAPSPKITASGPDIVTALAGHGSTLTTQFALTEGLPALALAIIPLAVARGARRSGQTGAAITMAAAALIAAAISLTQFVLGICLARTSDPGSAHLLYETVNRMDGVKMFALAVVGIAAAVTAVLPRWLRLTAVAMAATIVGSGIGYLLLLTGPAALAYASLPLLLVFITGAGLTLRAERG